MMEKAMRQMGIQTVEIPATEVIIKTPEKDLIISNPQVSKVSMGGQETFQIVGEVSEKSSEKFSKEDIQMIVEQTGCTEDEATDSLEQTGDIAEAILKLKK